jgi:hypothetical protein
MDQCDRVAPACSLQYRLSHSLGRSVNWLPGFDAAARKHGDVIPFANLLIGATALHLAYGIVTTNEGHFRMMPGLRVLAA